MRTTIPFTDALNRVQKYVVSTTMKEPLPWEHSTLLDGDGVAAVRELKRTHDKPLVVFGSGVLVQSLMREHLVDECILQIHPRVLGTGLRLFVDVPFTAFHLTESVTTKTGVIIAIYQRE